MAYKVELHRRAQKALALLARSTPRDFERIESAIDGLVKNPRPAGTKRLKSRAQGFRLRVGEYRVIYAVFDTDEYVHVLRVEHRRERTYEDIDKLLGD